MRYLSSLFLLTLVVLWSSCRNDFESESSAGNLQFSTDTLFLDTIFSNIGSSTYSFKVYNRTDNDLTIPTIELERGVGSNYRLNVDGIPGKSFKDIQVLAKDSIFVFVETTTDITAQTTDFEFLYTDKILFDATGNQQDVDLVTLVKDAVFLFPSRDTMTGEVETISLGVDQENNEIKVQGFFLDDNNLHFTNEKPYVIYGYAAIPDGETLTIDPGARIHFHSGSGLMVLKGTTLLVNGALSMDPELLENEVVFEGDRLEPNFSDTPGQWGTIWIAPESTGNVINYATIKNATVGIISETNDGSSTPNLTLSNTQIYNSSNIGLLANNSRIVGKNLVINNSGQVSFQVILGGNYTFNHCTITNYSSIGAGFRESPTMLIGNSFEVSDSEIVTDDLEANFTNCIIYGDKDLELLFNKVDGSTFNYSFKNSLIKFNDTSDKYINNPLYDFTNSTLYEGSIFNEEPSFKDPQKNMLNISEESFANGKASISGLTIDLLGNTRSTTAPDIGAYESAVFEEDEN